MLWALFCNLYVLLIFFSDEEKGKKMWAKYLEREDSKIVGECTLLFYLICIFCFISALFWLTKVIFIVLVNNNNIALHTDQTALGYRCAPLLSTILPCLCLSSDLFVGQLKSSLTCSECGYCSTVFDPFWDLSLPISKVSSLKCTCTFRIYNAHFGHLEKWVGVNGVPLPRRAMERWA